MCRWPSEIPLALAQLHRRIRRLVVHARGTPLGDGRAGGLGDDLVQRVGIGGDRARAGDVADGAEAHAPHDHGLARSRRRELGRGDEQPAALDHIALVGEIDARHGERLARDVLPDVELGPVREREYAQMLAGPEARVEEAPELGALVARVPLAELVAMREDALLRARLLLVAPRAAEERVELEF